MLRSMSHSYLASSLLLLQILLVGLFLGSGQRRLAVVSGLLSIPFAVSSVLFEDYWAPVRVTNLPVGPEDLVFSFATGGVAWLLAIWPIRDGFTPGLEPYRFLGRYVTCTILGLTLGAVCWGSGMGTMASAIVGIWAVWAALLWRRWDLWLLSVTGAIGFTVFYTVFVVAVCVVWPGFHFQWNSDNLWGPRILMVPLEEVAWALAYGAVWPPFMAFVFDARPWYKRILTPNASEGHRA